MSSDSLSEKFCGHCLVFLSVCHLFGVCLQYLAVRFFVFCWFVCFCCSVWAVLFSVACAPLAALFSLFFSSLSLGGRPGRGLLFLLRFLPCALRSRNLRRCRHVLACCALPPSPLFSFPPFSSSSPSSRPASPLSRCLSVCLSLLSLFFFFFSLVSVFLSLFLSLSPLRRECVTTHLPNGLAPKMDGVEAGD